MFFFFLGIKFFFFLVLILLKSKNFQLTKLRFLFYFISLIGKIFND